MFDPTPAPVRSLLALALLGLVAPLVVGCSAAPKKDPAETLAAIEERATRPIEASRTPSPQPVQIVGATVLTAAGTRYERGWITLVDGRIQALGAGTPPEVPGAKVIDATGRWVTPGLIDTHSHLGVYPTPAVAAHRDGNEATGATTPAAWAEHAFWPQDPGLELAAAGGVTTLQVLPGSANLIGGRGVVLHMAPQLGGRAMRFPGAPETVKMACGENPKRIYGQRHIAPGSRMGNLMVLRAALAKAQAHLRALNVPEPEAVARDLASETLGGVLGGRYLLQVHCYRADDMLTFLQVADEFGFRVRAFHHALEAYKIREILTRRGVAVATWADWWGFKMEAYDGIPENAAMVAAAGGRAIIHSDSRIGIQRLNQEAAKALFSGRAAGLELTENDALRWITANPAWALGIDSEVGTLEAGRRADIVVWSGSPFSVYARADLVFVDGELRYDASRRAAPWSDFMTGQEVVE